MTVFSTQKSFSVFCHRCNLKNEWNKNEITIKKNKANRIDYYVPSITLAKKVLKLKITINLLDAINSVIVLK